MSLFDDRFTAMVEAVSEYNTAIQAHCAEFNRRGDRIRALEAEVERLKTELADARKDAERYIEIVREMASAGIVYEAVHRKYIEIQVTGWVFDAAREIADALDAAKEPAGQNLIINGNVHLDKPKGESHE